MVVTLSLQVSESVGAEFLVNGASKIAAILRISPLIIGLTIVAYGTSAPEMSVSIMSTFSSQGDIAVGNVVGSNICNILLVLGMSSVVAPLVVTKQIIRSDVPIMIGVSLLLLMFSLDGQIGRVDGIILFVGGALYTLSLIYQSSKQTEEQDEFAREYSFSGNATPQLWIKNILMVVGGSSLLIFGSRLLVKSAVAIAQGFGVSELLIGLTIVAFGTSLPELATSIVASFRGERDIAVGNVLGSNIFNILAVLGIAGSLSPSAIEVSQTVIRFDLLVAIAVAFACLPIFYSGKRIDRLEGSLFLFYYLAYNGYLILKASNNPNLSLYSSVILYGFIPLTVLFLIVATVLEKKAEKDRKKIS